MNTNNINIATTQLNSTQSWVGLIFLWEPQPQTTKPQNHKTVSHFISAPTQPNSTKFSMQPYFNPTRRFMPKKMEDDLKNIKMEDDLKNFKMEDDL